MKITKSKTLKELKGCRAEVVRVQDRLLFIHETILENQAHAHHSDCSCTTATTIRNLSLCAAQITIAIAAWEFVKG